MLLPGFRPILFLNRAILRIRQWRDAPQVPERLVDLVARFLQVDSRLNKLVELAVAADIPLVY